METLQELFGLKGKTALITGASAGLGVEFATALAVAGADVAVVARRKERLEEVSGKIEKLGVRSLPMSPPKVAHALKEGGKPAQPVATPA